MSAELELEIETSSLALCSCTTVVELLVSAGFESARMALQLKGEGLGWAGGDGILLSVDGPTYVTVGRLLVLRERRCCIFAVGATRTLTALE